MERNIIMTRTDLMDLKAGDILLYNDGREGHQDVKAEVITSGDNFVVVQFVDRAESTTIYHHEKAWTDYLIKQANPQ